MSFKDFLGKNRWRISAESLSPKCQVEELISIDGSENDVIVRCLPDDHLYEHGIYDERTDVIFARDKSYTLSLVEDKRGLICDFPRGRSGSITGSWTAEDIGNLGDDRYPAPHRQSP